MMKKTICTLFLLIISFAFVSAHAVLNLELTQGIDAALPIAIVPFQGDQANVPGNVTMMQVIKEDLQKSGQFRVKISKDSQHQPAVGEKVDAPYWKQQGMDDVLVGKVENMGGNRYRVTFQLVSTYGKGELAIDQSYVVVQSGLRRLAHHISDMIYEKMTGVKGIFSTKVAYILVQRHRHEPTKYTLEVSDIDGFNPQALLESTQPIMSPSWSPNGKEIAYVSFEGHRAQIFRQTVATGMRHLIAAYPGVNGAPAFSPDGTKIALVLTLTSNPKIYIYDIPSRRFTRITKGYSIDTEPAWAPDGKSIIFTSNRGGGPQIYRYSFETKQVDRISFEGNYNARASFMPDGQSIVMMHRETGMFGVAREDLNTGNIEVLAQTGEDESPSLSPNGKMIIYATRYGGRGVLGLVSIDGRIKLRLPAREGSVREPAWSPFL